MRIIALALFFLMTGPAWGQGFNEEFTNPVLDPAWTVVNYSGPRYTPGYPANHFDLTSHPGYLRYFVDPMTFAEGFSTGMVPVPPNQWGYVYDPGLEIRRPLTGDRWQMEAKAEYYLPYSNGRAFSLNVYFGDGGPGTIYAMMNRGREMSSGDQNYLQFLLILVTGPNYADRQTLVYQIPDPYQFGGLTYTTIHWRFTRDGGHLTLLYSLDGTDWLPGFDYDAGTALSGKPQTLVLSGSSWFTPAGSYADWDYVHVAPLNRPPVADAGADRTVAAGLSCVADVQLNGSGSSDPDGDPLTFAWTGPDFTASGSTPNVSLGLGVFPITLSVDDGKGGTSSDDVVITVQDASPPVVTALTATPAVIWPPNNQLVPVTLAASVADNCTSSVNCRIVSITSNEPEPGDMVITGNMTAELRAKRLGTGSGRIYTITVECADTVGNKTTRTVTVSVPHDSGKS